MMAAVSPAEWTRWEFWLGGGLQACRQQFAIGLTVALSESLAAVCLWELEGEDEGC